MPGVFNPGGSLWFESYGDLYRWLEMSNGELIPAGVAKQLGIGTVTVTVASGGLIYYCVATGLWSAATPAAAITAQQLNDLAQRLTAPEGKMAVDGGGSSTGTVWDSIKATQPLFENSSIPRSFELSLENSKLWVHPNASEHIYQYTHSIRDEAMKLLVEQELLSSLLSAVQKIAAEGYELGKAYPVDGWEIVINQRAGDLYVATEIK